MEKRDQERKKLEHERKEKSSQHTIWKLTTIVTTLRRILVFACCIYRKKIYWFWEGVECVSSAQYARRFRMRDCDVTTRTLRLQQWLHSVDGMAAIASFYNYKQRWLNGCPLVHSHTNSPNQKHQTYKEKFVVFSRSTALKLYCTSSWYAGLSRNAGQFENKIEI